MAKHPMCDEEFEYLLGSIRQETNRAARKLEILYASRGNFTALQAARILEAIAIPQHKVTACQMMEPRLCPMTCDESRMILACVTLHNDKVEVLNSLKRVLCDCHSHLGKEYVLSGYPYETDKYRALRILQTVQGDEPGKRPAGGHQGYAPLGGLYTQSAPLDPHLYGTVSQQQNRGAVPPAADPGILPSVYSHPSYAYPKDKTYIQTKTYPEPRAFLEADEPGYQAFPPGAPPLGHHRSGANPIGYPGLS